MSAFEQPGPIHAFTDDVMGDHDATTLATLIRNGDLSAQEVLNAAIARAKKVDGKLNGIVTPAFDFDAPPATEPSRGFFAGVPTLIKDNTDLAGLPTLHGSKAVAHRLASQTNPFARQYMDQGFVALGKSSLPEFGFNASTEPAHGPSTRNPWNPAFSSGASSGGSAALVAAGVVPIAHANDGGGSIRIPAACCGLVGLKPSRNRMVNNPATKALPINIIGEGVVTRSVRDTAHFFAETEKYAHNPRLPAIGEVQGPAAKRLKIGLVIDSITGQPTDQATREAVEKTAALLESLGHTIKPMEVPIHPLFPEDFAHYWSMLAFLLSKTGKHTIGPGFDSRSVDDLTAGLARRFKSNLMKTPGMLWRLSRSHAAYTQGMEEAGVDLVLSPTLAHTTPKLGFLSPELPFEDLFERLMRYASFTPLANATGAPALTLPMGMTDSNLPIGVHFSAHHGKERTLLELAFELEAAAPWRRING
ncbi:amidase [Marinobacter sp. 1Y8]